MINHHLMGTSILLWRLVPGTRVCSTSGPRYFFPLPVLWSLSECPSQTPRVGSSSPRSAPANAAWRRSPRGPRAGSPRPGRSGPGECAHAKRARRGARARAPHVPGRSWACGVKRFCPRGGLTGCERGGRGSEVAQAPCALSTHVQTFPRPPPPRARHTHMDTQGHRLYACANVCIRADLLRESQACADAERAREAAEASAAEMRSASESFQVSGSPLCFAGG